MISKKTFILLGVAIYSIQKFEFGLYGLASHYTHVPQAQKDKRYQKLDPEKYLRGDLSELRVTLGQLAYTFGDTFYLKGDFLDEFLEKRNIIVHRFWRLTHDRRNDAPFEDPDVYLENFVHECEHWIKILRGILSLVIEGAAIKEGRESDFTRTDEDKACIKIFEEFIGAQYLWNLEKGMFTINKT